MLPRTNGRYVTIARPRLDEETLGRLIDGTLSVEERRHVLVVLSSSDADRRVLADTVRALEPTRVRSVVPHQRAVNAHNTR